MFFNTIFEILHSSFFILNLNLYFCPVTQCPTLSEEEADTSGGHIKRRRLLSVLSLAIRNLGPFEITVRDESTVSVCGMCIYYASLYAVIPVQPQLYPYGWAHIWRRGLLYAYRRGPDVVCSIVMGFLRPRIAEHTTSQIPHVFFCMY